MTETSLREHEAEFRVAHELLKHDILVAKPMFDRDGADLLALQSVKDGARFIKIQCKGRSLEGTGSAGVRIPEAYVTDDFAVFIYVRHWDGSQTSLFVFRTDEIRQWHHATGEYVLSITEASLNRLAKNRVSSDTIAKLKDVIHNAKVPQQITEVLWSTPAPTVFEDGTEVRMKRNSSGTWTAVHRDRSSGVESIGGTCVGDPSKYDYDHFSKTFSVRQM